MIPTYFLEIADTNIAKDVYKKYFNDQYPESNDCVVMDKHIADIQKDIDEINKRELAKKPECNCFPSIEVPCTSTGFSTGCFNGTKSAPNPEYAKGIMTRSKSKAFLNELLIKKKNLVALADCRNKIETVRQEETAQVFTETSAQAETRVLGETKKKQYLLMGVGAVVVVTSLIIFLVKRKK